MTKKEFVDSLRLKLYSLPRNEVEERLSFYCEMIDDRLEDGLSEEEAVGAIGSVDEIFAQIVSDIPLTKIVKSRLTPQRKLKGWMLALIIFTAPIWFSLIISAVAVIFSLYVVLWSLTVAAWAVFAAFALSGPCGLALGIFMLFTVGGASGTFIIACSIFVSGLALFTFFGALKSTVGAAKLSRAAITGIKWCFVGKEDQV